MISQRQYVSFDVGQEVEDKKRSSADEESRRRPTSEHSAERISSKGGGFVISHIIMNHPVSGCFGTSLAPGLVLTS